MKRLLIATMERFKSMKGSLIIQSPGHTTGGIDFPAAGIVKKKIGFLARYSNIQCQKVINSNLVCFEKFLIENKISMINQDVINLYQDSLRKADISNSTYNLRINSLKKYLEYKGIKNLEYKKQKVGRYENQKIITLTEIKSILMELKMLKEIPGKKQTKYLRDYILLNLMLITGLRKSEITQIKFNSIEYKENKYVFKTIGKRRKEIYKEFPSQLVSELFKLKTIQNKSDQDYIFTSDRVNSKGQLTTTSINQNLSYYHRKINQSNRTICVHGIRNLSARLVYDATKDPKAVQRHLGHASLYTTDIYLEATENSQKNDYNAVTAHLEL